METNSEVFELCPQMTVTIGYDVKKLAFELEYIRGEHPTIRVQNVLSALGACVDRDDRLLAINGLDKMHVLAPSQIQEMLAQRPLRLTVGSVQYSPTPSVPTLS